METIRNYLETMFLKLPNTPEVYKAKKRTLANDGRQIHRTKGRG